MRSIITWNIIKGWFLTELCLYILVLKGYNLPHRLAQFTRRWNLPHQFYLFLFNYKKLRFLTIVYFTPELHSFNSKNWYVEKTKKQGGGYSYHVDVFVTARSNELIKKDLFISVIDDGHSQIELQSVQLTQIFRFFLWGTHQGPGQW